MATVHRPYERVNRNVRNQSSRNGARIRLIVVHSTEGNNVPRSVKDLESLGNWFNDPISDASSHVGVDADGYSAEYVPDSRKAWTCAFYNSVSLNIECIGRASQPAALWTPKQYEKVAMYIAYWSDLYGIAIRKGAVSVDGRVIRSGVVRHSDLGSLGGNHRDPGRNFDLAHVNQRARTLLRTGW